MNGCPCGECAVVFVRSHSMDSVNAYRNGFKKFQNFLKTRYDCTPDEIVLRIKKQEIDVYELLRDFVVYLDKADFSACSIETWVASMKGYLRYSGIKIYSEDFKQVVKMPKKIRTQEMPLTKEILVRLLRNASPKLQTLILVAISSGMRIGELSQLKISDIDFDSNPTTIRLRAETTKSRESRITFLTSEATKALKDYLKVHFSWKDSGQNNHLSDKIIFGRTSKYRKKMNNEKKIKSNSIAITKILIQKSLRNSLKQMHDLNTKNERGRHAIHFHVFRKFCRTTVGNVVGRDFAEALIGHRFYMDTYYTLTDDKKREMFLEAEPHLTISDFKAVEKNLKSLSTDYNQLKKELDGLKEYLRSKSIGVPEIIN